MCFKSLKTRSKNPLINYFAHPFQDGNQMHLIADVDMKDPQSIKSIQEQLATTENIGNRGRKNANNRSSSVNTNKSNITSLRSSVAIDNDDDMDGL